MAEIHRLDVANLNPKDLSQYKLLTDKKFFCCLEGKDPYDITDTKIIALGITQNNRPIGLVIGSAHPTLSSADLHWLSVSEEFRHQGIGATLLHAFMKEIKLINCSFVTSRFSNDNPTAPYYKKILKKAEWGKPTLLVIRCFFDCYAFHPEWFMRSLKFPKQYSLFKWTKLSESDRHYVQHLIRQRGIPSVINPFDHEEDVEPINSIGIRYRDEVVGWMVTHRVDKDTISYAKLFLLPEHRGKGNPIKMLAHSIRKQQHSEVQFSIFETNVEHSGKSWVSFVERRLKPPAQAVTEIYQSHFDL